MRRLLEETVPLVKAARQKGIHRRTLAQWLEEEGIRVPRLGKGNPVLVRPADVERVCAKRTALPAYAARMSHLKSAASPTG